jgi:5-methyltetrahydrofolate--homocysteine methyltransferase
MMDKIQGIYRAVIEGDMDLVSENVQAALVDGLPASDILQNALIAAMEETGRLFEIGDRYVPEMLVSARAMKAGLSILEPLLVDFNVEPVGKVVIGTVKGDHHDIGKNLVAMMLEGSGFKIVDLGIDVSPEQFVAALENDVDILGLSTLLTTTMPSMEKTIKAIEAAGLRERVKVMVGGAPITLEYSQRISADGFASDASQAVTLAKSLLSNRSIKNISLIGTFDVFSRDQFYFDIQKEIERFDRYNHPFSLVMYCFEERKDPFSNDMNIEIYKGMIQIIRSQMRKVDTIYQFDTGTFIFLLPETSHENAVTMTERIQGAIFNKYSHTKNQIAFKYSLAQYFPEQSIDMTLNHLENELLEQ